MGVHEGKSIVYLINQLFISVEKTPTSFRCASNNKFVYHAPSLADARLESAQKKNINKIMNKDELMIE